jgi:aminopeptidase N
VSTDFSDRELAFFMARDTDGFNRWDAAQTLILKEIKQLVTKVRKNRSLDVSPLLIQAFETALAHPDRDKAFLAKVLTLPQETQLKDHFTPIDVTAIHKARTFLQQALAQALKRPFLHLFDQCASADPSSLSATAMADRSLKNQILSYLGSLKEDQTYALVKTQFDTAQNMTDEFAALTILCRMDEKTRDLSTQRFFDKWHGNPLVMDKWFAVQADSPLADTLDRVENLTSHSHFSMTNPNKVRALLYTFALHNPIRFHSQDGRGYMFYARKICELDKINHQIAARLATAFSHWKRYDPVRQELMKKAQEMILATPGLSRNVYEIVFRSLE